MTFHDPRETLASAAKLTGDEPDVARPEVVTFTESGDATQVARGQNFVLAWTAGAENDTLEWEDNLGYIVLVPSEETAILVRHQGSDVRLCAPGIVTVPPGESTVHVEKAGQIARLFPAASSKAAALAQNAESYGKPHPRVRQITPVNGEVNRLRAHRLDDYPNPGGRFGTIFRTETLMVNFIDDMVGPRDPEKLSPHHHEDFEQGSFTVEGKWLHHIRTPWVAQRSRWREDEHIEIDGASLTIIPPPTVHTSQAVGQKLNRMIDIFAPARDDFEERGWVVNAADYGGSA